MKHFDYPGSGFALAAKNKGKWKHVYQGLTCIGGTSITSQSLFDLASLTKVVATLPICLILLKRRELDLKEKVKFYIFVFRRNVIQGNYLFAHFCDRQILKT